MPTKAPTLSIERDLWADGHDVVVGIDEVGRGSWAGPLVVGAAVLPTNKRVNGVRDSKMLTEARREELFDRIASWCSAWSIGIVTNEECDIYGMSYAQKLAATRAIEGLGVTPDHFVIDGKWNFVGSENVTALIKADAKCLSVAAASILAKVSRDRMMREFAPTFPEYNFENNKGYPCPIHKVALVEHGMTALHRKSWNFMANLNGENDEQLELIDAEA